MKKNTRLILLAVLTLLMVGLLAVAASAATVDVYTDGETPEGGYDNFARLCKAINLEDIDPAAITRIVINADTEMAAADGAINLSGLTLPVTIVGNGHKLTVSKDFTLPGDVTIENLNLYMSAVVNAGKKVTFDGGSITSGTEAGTPTRLFVVNDAEAEIVGMNGFTMNVNKPSTEAIYLRLFKSVTFTNCAIETWGYAFLMNDDANNTGILTLNNCTVNTGNGRKDYTWYYSGNGAKNAQVIVNGGTYYGKMHSGGSKIIINNGQFESNEQHIFELVDGDITGMLLINDGNFKLTAAGALIKVSNAPKIKGSVWADADPDKAAVRILDGTFEMTGNGAIIYDYLCGGEDYQNGTKQVLFNNPNAVYNVVVEGGTFKTNNIGSDGVIFRLGNCTLGTKVIIRGGTFENNGGWRGLFNAAGADIEISNGNFTSNGRIFGMHDSDRATDGAYSLTITGGSFTSTGNELLYLGGAYASTVEINISGGTFSSTGVSVMQFANASFGANCVITGGTFTNPNGYVFAAAGAAITISTVEGTPAPVFTSENVIFQMVDNDVLSRVTINGGVFNATGNGKIFLIGASAIKRNLAGEMTNVEDDGAKKGRVTIQGGTFSSEFGAAIEYTTIYNLAQVTITAGDFTACKVPLKMCTDSQLTGIELLTAGCIATNTFHMLTPAADGSSTSSAAGTTWYKDVEALWNNLDNSYEDGEITLLADQNYAIDLTGHNFYAVVHVNGKAINPGQITGAVLGDAPEEETVTMDCSKTVIASSQVTLKDNIVVSFKGVRLAHGQTKLVVTIAGKRFELKVGDAVQTEANAYRAWHEKYLDPNDRDEDGNPKEKSRYHYLTEVLPEYTFTFEGLVPQCYDTNVTITDEAGTGTEIFNLKAYCEAVKVDKPEFTAVADALLVYGEAARQYVENEVVAAPEGFEAPTPGDVSKTEITGVVFQSARLNLADKVSLVFRVELTGNLAEYTVTVGGNPVTPVLVEGTTYDITVDLAASQLTDGITLSVVKGEETATLTYGVANYIVNMQSDTAIANFLKAIWLYGVAAAATV